MSGDDIARTPGTPKKVKNRRQGEFFSKFVTAYDKQGIYSAVSSFVLFAWFEPFESDPCLSGQGSARPGRATAMAGADFRPVEAVDELMVKRG